MRSSLAALAGLVIVIGGGGVARAQGVDRRYAEAPTGGLALPTTPLAGDADARAVSLNPGGLALVRGFEGALALGLEDPAVADAGGPGFGIFGATVVGGGLVPRLGVGIGLEWLRPSRGQLVPDPGAPFRATVAVALPLGRQGGLGLALHRFSSDGALDGVTTWDLGWSHRLGNHLALGATARDLATGPIAGRAVARRYEAEVAVRPLGTDRLELGLGGRIEEARGGVDGWLRLSARALDGLYLQAAVETRALRLVDTTPAGTVELDGRDVRATVGFELAVDGLAFGSYARGLRDAGGARHPLGGTFVVRLSSSPASSLAAPADHLEQIELGGEPSLREVTALVRRLRAIAADPSARGVVVTFDGLGAGYGTLQELREELLRIRRAGKKVFAYFVAATGRDYFVASAADKIYADPAGVLRLVGIAGTSIYFRGAFDLVGVLPQFDKIAEYKSAPEQFTDVGPSEPAARMRAELFDGIWDTWVEAIASGRHLDKAAVQALVDGGPYTAGELAADHRLVDAVAPPEQIDALINKELGGGYPVARPTPAPVRAWAAPRIAVIYVEGDITDGASRTVPVLGRLAGGDTVRAALVAARTDPSIEAVVLRINSPGGSALASELMAREVFAFHGVKPIVCSMSDLAASGGYFIAAGCDRIFAEETTITGSIGIFTGKFDVSGLLARIGVTTDTYKRGARADAESMFRPYTAEERRVLLEKLGYMYGRFVGAVADGRAMTKAEVDEVGRGHVWTGAQGKAHKLVDELGGLGAALEEAARRGRVAAGYELVELPAPPPSVLGVVGRLLGVEAGAGLTLADLPQVKALLGAAMPSVLVAPEVPQARLPFDVRWP